MNSGVLTSEVENIELDIESLSNRFLIYQVCYKGLDKERRNVRKKLIPSEIYSSSPVLSLIDAMGNVASYYVLLNKQDHFNFQHEELSIKRAKMADMLEVFVARLLLAALPRLINEDGSEKLKRFEADGVNYLVDYKNIGGSRTTKKMLITVGVDITPDWGFKNEYGYPRQNLSVGVQSFTPIEQRSKADGEVYKSYQSKQRYCLDEWTQIISKNVSGDYIKAAFDGSKNRVKAIDFSNEELETFELSRVGVLAQCLSDIETAYSGAFRVDLKRVRLRAGVGASRRPGDG